MEDLKLARRQPVRPADGLLCHEDCAITARHDVDPMASIPPGGPHEPPSALLRMALKIPPERGAL
jgi:hypothetical protein